MKKISLFLIYFISFFYLEMLYKFLMYSNIFKISLLNMIAFLISFSLIMTLISKLFNDKTNKIIYFIIMSITCVWFGTEYVVKDYFDFYVSLSTLTLADQLGDFAGKGVIETLKRIPGVIAILLPLILSIIFNKKINFKKYKNKKIIVFIGLILISIVINRGLLLIDKKDSYSPYNLYYKVNDVSLNMETLGVLNTLELDIYRTIFGFEVDIQNTGGLGENENDEPKEIVYEYNNLDIDFSSIEGNSNIKKINDYMLNEEGTKQNEYTGKFKNKNLILFMAESFNEVAVRKDTTPTLYKLVNSGFSFSNYYTPTIYSTIGGEFQELTGLYAESTKILGTFRSGNVTFPQGIGKVFKDGGYSTFAYHNNSYTFQDRNKYLKSLGFDNFIGCNNGMEKLINCKTWPQSDLDMINATIDNYIDEDKFMVFYATVSGHSGYTFANAMAKKNKEEYMGFNLNYSEGPASYLAAQMELDKALDSLITKLEEKNKLKDTVIVLVGDHYPYELTVEQVNEISNYEKDGIVEINHSNLILWNSDMETVKVDKVGSQLDVMPTVYNLFGINYDSRLFMGNDILSTSGGLAMFANRSWVTDYGTYFSSQKKFVSNGKELPSNFESEEDYVKTVNTIVNNKITMSNLIIQNNYYNHVFK